SSSAASDVYKRQQFPAVHTYEDLKREFLKASSRSLSL
ncbi:bifunctional phosphoserine phosphatase/homoserine phosphotransferase ThrH, partial [Pseudomonas aeruginosa]|nr:bifunctional phosphoserine phosphatase/homoserine phosphotransferase ThrH [Pseudomonas aeruginosa]